MSEPPEGTAPARRTRAPGRKRKIDDYRDLRVWRKASRLADQCRAAAAAFPAAHANLAGVISRLAEEIPGEIAMGQGQRLHAAYLSHLETSRIALRHLERRLIEAHKSHCLLAAAGDPMLALAAKVDRMLTKLMVSLELAHLRRRQAATSGVVRLDTGEAKR